MEIIKNFFKKNKKNLLLFSFLIAVAFIFWNSITIKDWFYNAVSFFDENARKNESLASFIFILLAAVSAMLAPLSSAPLVPGAILIWDDATVFFLLWGGWILGHGMAYSIGRFAGYPILKYLINFKKIEEYKEKLAGKLGFLLVFLFCLAMPAEVPGYALGSLRYSAWKYIAAIALAEFPFALITVYASNAFIEENPLAFLAWMSLGLALAIGLFYFFQKKFKLKNMNKPENKIKSSESSFF